MYGCVVAGRASLALHLARAGHVKRFCLLLSPSNLAEADGLDVVAASTASTASTASSPSGDALTSSHPPLASRLLTSRLLQGIFVYASTIACECSR